MKRVTFLIVAALGFCLATGAAGAQSIVDQWATVAIPTPPPLKPVTVDPKTTALLVLDFMKQNCGVRQRCLATVPNVKKLLTAARAKGMPVIYSIIANTTTADILPELAIAPNEPWVQSGPNKFYNTNLEKLLADRGIKTVIVTGTSANGAVLYTGSVAAFMGLNVIVPVDGMSNETAFPELYTAWNFANAPTVSARSTLTTLGTISF